MELFHRHCRAARLRTGVLEPLDDLRFARRLRLGVEGAKGYRRKLKEEHDAGDDRNEAAKQHERRGAKDGRSDDGKSVLVQRRLRQLNAHLGAVAIRVENGPLDPKVLFGEIALVGDARRIDRVELQHTVRVLQQEPLGGALVGVKGAALDRQLHDVERALVAGVGGKSLRRVGDHRRDAGPALHVVGEPADGIAVGLSRCLAGAKRRPPAHRLLAREADLGKRDVIVGRQILLHDFLHDVLPDANAKPQLADLPAGRARFEFVTDVAKTERALRVGRLRIEHDLERLRNVRDDDVQVGDPDIMLINDETDSGGRHGVGPRLCEAAMQVVRDPPTAGDAHRASESTDALQATSLLRADVLARAS